MNISVHIEQLILDGLPIAHGQGGFVQAAVELELARLLAAETPRMTGGALARVHVGDLRLRPQSSPAEIGQQIGRAIHAGINRSVESDSISAKE